jgi:hypothetical protein
MICAVLGGHSSLSLAIIIAATKYSNITSPKITKKKPIKGKESMTLIALCLYDKCFTLLSNREMVKV